MRGEAWCHDMNTLSGGASSSPGRAGDYQMQPEGYRAFVPRSLPPDPPLNTGGDFQRLLSQADHFLGRLDGSVHTLPNPDLFVLMYVRREAVLSSQIEGTQSSLQDLLTAEAKVFQPGRPSDVGEVIRYVAAMNHGLKRLRELPLSVDLLCEIHKELMQGMRGGDLMPGELRREQNWLGPSGCTLQDAIFVPPPPEEVKPALGDLENFLRIPGELPSLVQIGLAHAQFETIHPFLDGNGRMGRLLITFCLCQQEILHQPVLYLSHYFMRYRRDYYECLQAVRDQGDWEGWLEFFLQGVLNVSREAVGKARQILELREKHRSQISDQFSRMAGNGHRLLEYLYEFPILSVPVVQQLFKVTHSTANTMVSRLVRLGILEEITGHKRNRV